MESSSHLPSELPRSDDPVVPRPAATVIVVRGGADALELLLLRRAPGARVMAGVWVFPGGAQEPAEDLRSAAVREVAEESGIALGDPGRLIAFSRWITPAGLATRFDTHFFLAPAPAGAQAKPDGVEIVDAAWYEPRAALEANRAGALELVFPTIRHLEALKDFSSADELLQWAPTRVVEPVQPRLVSDGEAARIVLPGEPGYDRP